MVEQNRRQILWRGPGLPIAQLTFNYWAVSLDFSSDSRLWASGGFHDRIIVADAATGQPVRELKPDSPVGDLALSPNSQWLAAIMSGSWGPSTVAVWDIFTEERRTLAEFRLFAYANVAFSPDSRWLAAGLAGDEPAVAVWQTQTWHLVSQIELAEVAWDITFSPDSRWLAVGLGQEVVSEAQLWDVTTATLAARMPHTGQVLTTSFSHDGRWIVTGGGNSLVKVWEIVEGK